MVYISTISVWVQGERVRAKNTSHFTLVLGTVFSHSFSSEDRLTAISVLIVIGIKTVAFSMDTHALFSLCLQDSVAPSQLLSSPFPFQPWLTLDSFLDSLAW